MADVLLRFNDLKARGIVRNHPTLSRWIKEEGFPPGRLLGPNTRAWRESEVEAWLDSRPSEPSPAAIKRAGCSNAVQGRGAHAEPDAA